MVPSSYYGVGELPPRAPAAGAEAAPGGDEEFAASAPSSRPMRRPARPPLYPWEPMLLPALQPRNSEIEHLLHFFWYPAAIFALSELCSLITIRKSFFAALTAKAFEIGPDYARVVEVHIWASAMMWALAAMQVLGERLRKNPSTAWLHRRCGQTMLLDFFLVIFPTSIYLSVKQRIDYLAFAVAAVLFDTAFCSAYFLYRGYLVARARRREASSLALHGRLMQCGIMMSMSILPQRLLQLYLTLMRRSGYKPFGSQAAFEDDPGTHQLNYTISIIVTSVLFVLCGHFFDGPRGGIWIACIGAENAEEAFGTAQPSQLERRLWRSRWLLYIVVYKILACWFSAAAPTATVAPTTTAKA